MSFTIYLVRHAVAADPEEGMADAERPLTAAGIRKMKRVAGGLKRLRIEPDVILSSPFKRAVQTADILVEALMPGSKRQDIGELAPDVPAEELEAALNEYRSKRQLMLVGHQPDLGKLAAHLLTRSSGAPELPFRKGGVAAIEVAALPPRTAGTLLWLLTPKQLRLIGR